MRKLRFLMVPIILLGCTRQVTRHHSYAPPLYHEYHIGHFDWASVRRILVMPLAIESGYSQSAEDVRASLITELRKLCAFDVVIAPVDLSEPTCQEIRSEGEFDEVELIQIGHRYQVDAVLIGAVTEYRAYPPPRVGMSVQLISVGEAAVIAGVDGVCDARDQGTIDQAREFFQETSQVSFNLLGKDLVQWSPDQFNRYVCHQVASTLAAIAGSH